MQEAKSTKSFHIGKSIVKSKAQKKSAQGQEKIIPLMHKSTLEYNDLLK
jgi:hypothetical protein